MTGCTGGPDAEHAPSVCGCGRASLSFVLEIEEGWPPAAVECLPATRVGAGYQVLVPPLFVKDLSVGDVVHIDEEEEQGIFAWRHLERSGHTTIWLLRLQRSDEVDRMLASALERLRELGCFTSSMESWGAYAIDLPGTVSIRDADEILDRFDPEVVAVAFPSMRHDEEPP